MAREADFAEVEAAIRRASSQNTEVGREGI